MNSQVLVKAVTDQLKRKAREAPNSPVFFYNGNGYKPKDIIKEIKNETEFGKFLIEEIVKTATDMFANG